MIRAGSWRSRVAFARIRCGIARRIGLSAELLEAAPVEVVHPCEQAAGPPCIALPGQFERILACPYGIEAAEEIARVQGASHTIGATRRYIVDNALVVGGIVYALGRRRDFNAIAGRAQWKQPWTEHGEVALRSSLVGCHFFGHWLRDDAATHLLAQQYGDPMALPTPPWPDRADYLDLLDQSYAELGPAFVRRLILFDDIHQNTHKVQRFRILREQLARGVAPSAAGRIIYLRRGSGGAVRRLVNEADIIEHLERRGVEILEPETISAKRLVEALYGARLVISIEGSQLSHALMTLREGGGVLAIQEPDRFFNSHMDWAHPLGMRYGIVVAQRGGDGGLRLPPSELLHTIDLMDAALG